MSVFSFPLLIKYLMIQGKGYKSNLNEVGKSTFDGLASTNLGWICLKMFGGDFQGGWNLERNYSNKRKYCIKTFWFFFNCELICPMHTYVSNTRNASTNFISYLLDLEELIFSEMFWMSLFSIYCVLPYCKVSKKSLQWSPRYKTAWCWVKLGQIDPFCPKLRVSRKCH